VTKNFDAVLVVDAGDMFHTAQSVSEGEKALVDARSDLLIKAFNKQPCEAYAIGDRDLSALGVEKLKELAGKAKYPFLCANLLDAKGEPVFKPYVVVEKAGYKIGLLGIVHGGAQPKDAEGYTVQGPADAAKKYVPELEKEGVDAIVLLAHLDKVDATAVVDAAKGIDLVLGGQAMGFSRFLESLGTAWFVDGGQRGKFVNTVTMHFQKKGHSPFVVREEAGKIKEEISTMDARIKRYVELSNGPDRPGTRASSKDRFKGVIESMLTERKALAEKAKGLAQVNADAPFLTFESVSLSRDKREDTETAGWVTEFEKAFPAAVSTGHATPSREAMKAIRSMPRPSREKK